MVEDNFLKGNKIFIYLGTVKFDEDIEVFFNRSFSFLKNEFDVMIMGVFNDWRWKLFIKRLEKIYFIGDWWVC